MQRFTLVIIIYVTINTLSLMYITQPLQPLFGAEFGVSLTKASLLTSIIFLPLSLAPIFYGYLLESNSPKKILTSSLSILGIVQLILPIASSYEQFLSLRFLQALFIPAVITTILTILTRIDQQNVQKYIGIYVASGVVGGLLGRLLGGYMTSLYSWQVAFIILGISMLIGAYLISRLKTSARVDVIKPTLRDITSCLHDSRYILLFIMAFVLFFSFQAILNFLPFRAKELAPEIKEEVIGLLYLGLIIGVAVSLLATKITRMLGSKENAITFGLVLCALSTVLMLSDEIKHLIGAVFVLCAGMFITHTTLSSLTNSISSEKKGIINGFYLAFYYTGGTLGSIAPGIVYKHFGWGILALCIGALLLLFSGVFFRNKTLFQ
ncbi:MAG: MFS transporter [Wolinella sp.]